MHCSCDLGTDWGAQIGSLPVPYVYSLVTIDSVLDKQRFVKVLTILILSILLLML